MQTILIIIRREGRVYSYKEGLRTKKGLAPPLSHRVKERRAPLFRIQRSCSRTDLLEEAGSAPSLQGRVAEG